MDSDKIFEFMTKMYAEMQDGFKGVNERLTSLESDYGVLKEDVGALKGDFGGFKEDVGTLKGDFGVLKGDFGSLKEDVGSIRATVAKIEVEHGQKLSALFDGYVQNSDKLDRIEAEVAKHEEFIIKRIK